MNFRVFLESTINDLYTSTINFAPLTKLRQHAVDPIKITQLSIIPYKGMRTIYFKGLAQNEQRQYNPIILFRTVRYDSKSPNAVHVVADDGLEYVLDKLSPSINEVSVRCDCLDFHWRGVYPNYLDNSLYGRNRKKYESKNSLPPSNPTNAPMMCKHLISLTRSLKDSGILLA